MWDKLYEAETLAVGTHWTNVSPGLGDLILQDYRTVHSLELGVSGAAGATVTITPYTSVSGKNWLSNGPVISAFEKTGGPGSDGLIGIPLSLIPGDMIRFKIEVGVDAATLDLYFTQK